MSVINVNHVTFYYDGSYETIFEDVSFSVDTDWKLGFVGRNGRGRRCCWQKVSVNRRISISGMSL